eukprot:GGOE01043725.1.p1 GENE.GGOE01043725.1~~GGOE01043725.1.p1  ORF type:complete len:250 (-),score=61.87 GGOE01043725.1:150-899(-)
MVPGAGKKALRIVVRPYTPADEATVHHIFSAGMMSIVTPLWRGMYRKRALLPILSCIPPAAVLLATRTVMHFSKWPLCLLSALAVPSLLWLWVHHMLQRYIHMSLREDLKDIATFYSASGAGPGSMFWVACAARDEEEGKEGLPPTMEVIGTVGLERKSAQEAELRRMSVRAEYQGCGVAQQLCRALLDHAKQSGFETVVLSTSSGQPPAMALYEKMGWKEDRVTSVFLGLFSIHHFSYQLSAIDGGER